MEKLTDLEIKQTAYQILCDVASFCDANEIRYYLVCGTALGAVRHNGFIPWDDDIDIGMPRPDYERFLKVYKSDRYYLTYHEKDPKYPYAFAKVCDPKTKLIENIEHPCNLGVYIDVFPIDGLPEDEVEIQRHLKKIRWDLKILSWKRISSTKKVGAFHKLIQIVAKIVLSAVSVRTLVRNLDRDVKLYPYESAEKVGHFVTVAVWGTDVKPKKIFEKRIRHEFEDSRFWIPGDYDQYLTLEYGDYMKLPPKEKQVNKHDFEAYWVK